jgi:hypothetical protein
MRKEVKNVEIQQTENGYILRTGSFCTNEKRDEYVFQSFTELINFLNQHFTFRNDSIITDLNYQTSIILKLQ